MKLIVMDIIANYQTYLTALITMLTGIIAVALLIPGPQPEKALQAVVDFLEKFSRKPPTDKSEG